MQPLNNSLIENPEDSDTTSERHPLDNSKIETAENDNFTLAGIDQEIPLLNNSIETPENDVTQPLVENLIEIFETPNNLNEELPFHNAPLEISEF